MTDDFTRTLEQLDQIYESYTNGGAYKTYTPQEQQLAQQAFKAKAKNLILDYDNFHIGYDEDLIVALGNTGPQSSGVTNPSAIQMLGKIELDDMFKSNGEWKARGSYKYIKQIEAYCKYYNKFDLLKSTKLCWGLVYGSDPNKLAQQTLPFGNRNATASGSAATGNSTNSNPAAASGIAGSPLEIKKRKIVDRMKQMSSLSSVVGKLTKDTTTKDFSTAVRFFITYMLKYCMEDDCTYGPKMHISVSLNKTYCNEINSKFRELRDIVLKKKYDKVDIVEAILDDFARKSFASTINKNNGKIMETTYIYTNISFVPALALVCKQLGWDMKDYDWTIFNTDGLFLRALLQVGVLGDY